MENTRWRLLAEHFDTAVSLPPHERDAYVERVCAGDAKLRAELQSLLAANDSASGFLDEAPPAPDATAAPEEPLPPGLQISAWRIVGLIGRGGMGEVYEVQRADGQFQQRAALKVTRRESARFLDRFNAERQILARLDHPGIARLLDGGVTPDGRPYAVMEYVEGQTITRYCDEHGADLGTRLAIFLQVCDAVAHAHGHLIVHRDIKPGNVLVAVDGRVRLLDFGIAKPLDAGAAGIGSGEATSALLTPDYAAPEQLTGDPITTATDVYALGMLLFELLVGRRPRITEGMPLARILRSMLDERMPLASEVAAATTHPRVSPRLLKGDLDAIIAKCLRPEGRQRYETVNALKLDVERSISGNAVLARGDARLYVLGRMVRRYRWVTASVAALVLFLSAGIAATSWQAARANREAARASAARDFLLSVFRESDIRIARDRPAGDVTAKELLDGSVDRIATQFEADPETQLQLLGVVSEIYGYWGDDDRFTALLEKRKQIAARNFGPTHPAYIESLLIDAWSYIYPQDFASALRVLNRADALIRQGGHENSILRANYWSARAEALRTSDPAQRRAALDNAVALFAELAPKSSDYAIALANSAVASISLEDYAGATQRSRKAVEVFQLQQPRNDLDLSATYANLGRSLQQVGEYAAAERAYEEAARLKIKMEPQRSGSYWTSVSDHARMVHMRGDRARAHRMFDELFTYIPADWNKTTESDIVRERYAERLAAEGRAAEALPFLEAAERSYIERPLREFDLRRARQTLGDAYDRLGRSVDARRALSAARAERMQKDAPDSVAVLGVRERWARFLLGQDERKAAASELQEILTQSDRRAVAPVALAHSDLAQLALLEGDNALALKESQLALDTFDKAMGLFDVRIGPVLWRTHATVLERNGDTKGAELWNRRAAEASASYDAP